MQKFARTAMGLNISTKVAGARGYFLCSPCSISLASFAKIVGNRWKYYWNPKALQINEVYDVFCSKEIK